MCVYYLVSILHHMAGVGFGLYDLELFGQSLFAQILLKKQTHNIIKTNFFVRYPALSFIKCYYYAFWDVIFHVIIYCARFK